MEIKQIKIKNYNQKDVINFLEIFYDTDSFNYIVSENNIKIIESSDNPIVINIFNIDNDNAICLYHYGNGVNIDLDKTFIKDLQDWLNDKGTASITTNINDSMRNYLKLMK